jgi:hypothetical protein
MSYFLEQMRDIVGNGSMHKPTEYYQGNSGVMLQVKFVSPSVQESGCRSVDLEINSHSDSSQVTSEYWLPLLTMPLMMEQDGTAIGIQKGRPIVCHVREGQSTVYKLEYLKIDGTETAKLSRIVEMEKEVVSGGMRLRVVGDSAKNPDLLEQYEGITIIDANVTLQRFLDLEHMGKIDRQLVALLSERPLVPMLS